MTAHPAGEPQSAAAVLMVRPAAFGSNPQTLPTNAFQAGAAKSPEIQRRAQLEFDGTVAALEDAGVRVHVFDGLDDCEAPDEVFPNNWVSFHADGTAVLYPLLAPNRRLERRADLVAALEREHGYSLARIVDLSEHEAEG
ncbi:MAG TPA: arginine deiminase-related protein, partial [Gammaproteobacteria bacterium]|nr:arginine deiminase-related protein [Gammaproteobacteria bacterium]